MKINKTNEPGSIVKNIYSILRDGSDAGDQSKIKGMSDEEIRRIAEVAKRASNRMNSHPSGSFLDAVVDIFGKDKDDEDVKECIKAMQMMKETRDEKREGVFPDTFGADSYFVLYFVTEEMSEDFAYILLDFYKHEAGAVDSFNKIDYIGVQHHTPFGEGKINSEGINLIFNAFRSGNEYARHTLQNLYKTYYKTEYRSFKRYKVMDDEGLFTFAQKKDESGEYVKYDLTTAARILTMCQVFGVEIDQSAWGVYHIIEDKVREYFELINKKTEIINIDRNDLDSSDEELYALDTYVESKEGREIRSAIYQLADEIARRNNIYPPEDPSIRSFENNLFDHMISTSLLKKNHESLAFTPREKAIISVLTEYETILCDGIISRDVFIDAMLKNKSPEDIRCSIADEKTSTENKKESPAHNAKEDKNDDLSDLIRDYMKEIEALRIEKKHKEQDITHYRQLYDEAREESLAQAKLIEDLQRDRAELYSLRNYVYSLTEADIEEESDSLDDMIAAIESRKVVVVGGHPNWTYKFRNMFPGWRFIEPSPSGSVDAKILDGADRVLFFSDIISHSVYNKYVDLAREKKVPFGYLHSTNVDASIKEMYKEMMREGR